MGIMTYFLSGLQGFPEIYKEATVSPIMGSFFLSKGSEGQYVIQSHEPLLESWFFWLHDNYSFCPYTHI